MERKIREVVYSKSFQKDLELVYEYGVDTFGYNAANYFINDVYLKIYALSTDFYVFPECRHLPTKSKIYRNIIIGAYLIIYRITPARIQVLNIIHGSRSVAKIKNIRKIKL